MADDFAEKLSAILGNPEAMGQIMNIAQALGGGGEAQEAAPPPQPVAEAPAPPPVPAVPAAQPAASSPPPDLSGILGMLGGLTGGGSASQAAAAPAGNPLSALADLDPRLIQMGMRLMSEYNNTDDRKTILLSALRPFVKEERFDKVDRAIQIAKLSRVIRVALTVFKESAGGGEEHHV